MLVGFLVSRLDLILFIHDADEEGYLPANAIASTAPTKEICLRGDHKRGIRRATNQTPAGCQYEIEINSWTAVTVDSPEVFSAIGERVRLNRGTNWLSSVAEIQL